MYNMQLLPSNSSRIVDQSAMCKNNLSELTASKTCFFTENPTLYLLDNNGLYQGTEPQKQNLESYCIKTVPVLINTQATQNVQIRQEESSRSYENVTYDRSWRFSRNKPWPFFVPIIWKFPDDCDYEQMKARIDEDFIGNHARMNDFGYRAFFKDTVAKFLLRNKNYKDRLLSYLNEIVKTNYSHLNFYKIQVLNSIKSIFPSEKKKMIAIKQSMIDCAEKENNKLKQEKEILEQKKIALLESNSLLTKKMKIKQNSLIEQNRTEKNIHDQLDKLSSPQLHSGDIDFCISNSDSQLNLLTSRDMILDSSDTVLQSSNESSSNLKEVFSLDHSVRDFEVSTTGADYQEEPRGSVKVLNVSSESFFPSSYFVNVNVHDKPLYDQAPLQAKKIKIVNPLQSRKVHGFFYKKEYMKEKICDMNLFSHTDWELPQDPTYDQIVDRITTDFDQENDRVQYQEYRMYFKYYILYFISKEPELEEKLLTFLFHGRDANSNLDKNRKDLLRSVKDVVRMRHRRKKGDQLTKSCLRKDKYSIEMKHQEKKIPVNWRFTEKVTEKTMLARLEEDFSENNEKTRNQEYRKYFKGKFISFVEKNPASRDILFNFLCTKAKQSKNENKFFYSDEDKSYYLYKKDITRNFKEIYHGSSDRSKPYEKKLSLVRQPEYFRNGCKPYERHNRLVKQDLDQSIQKIRLKNNKSHSLTSRLECHQANLFDDIAIPVLPSLNEDESNSMVEYFTMDSLLDPELSTLDRKYCETSTSLPVLSSLNEDESNSMVEYFTMDSLQDLELSTLDRKYCETSTSLPVLPSLNEDESNSMVEYFTMDSLLDPELSTLDRKYCETSTSLFDGDLFDDL